MDRFRRNPDVVRARNRHRTLVAFYELAEDGRFDEFMSMLEPIATVHPIVPTTHTDKPWRPLDVPQLASWLVMEEGS